MDGSDGRGGPDEATLRSLVETARAAAGRAWAPYSRYRVGAALRAASGAVTAGTNVENASYGLSNCAERTAVFAARAAGAVDPSADPIVAVAVHSPDERMPWPCGACRQVLREFAGEGCVVLVDGREGTVRTTLGELLPRAFEGEGA